MRRWLRRWGWVAGLVLVIGWAAGAARAGDADPVFTPIVLALTVNGTTSDDAFVLLTDGSGALWMDVEDFGRLRLKPPPGTPRVVDGHRYLPLAAIPGAVVEIDAPQGKAAITVPALAFRGVTRSAAAQAAPALTPSPPGAFLNYQVYGQTGDYTGASNSSLTTELGIFASTGVLTSTAVAVRDSTEDRAVRLETTFTHDFMGTLQTLRLGDAITTPGSWDGAVRFAGIQWGTNFALRPDLLTLPLLSVAGQAALPSTVDVFVNGHQVTSQQVPPGPFVVDRLPSVTGNGNVTLVVQDAEGRTQVVNVPFYSSTTLLQAGLSSYSVELGAVRDNFALDSDDYGPAVVAGTWRHGFTNAITVEGHAESEAHGAHSAGVQFAERVGSFGVLDSELAVGGVAASAVAPGSSGAYAGVGFEHAARPFNFAARIQWAGAGFSDLAATPQSPLPRVQTILQAGYDLHRAGNLAVAIAVQKYAAEPTHRVFSVTHNLPVGERGFLSLTASRTISNTNGTSVYLVYTRAIGANRSVGATLRYDDTLPSPQTQLAGTLQQNAPVGNGEGYRVTAASDLSYDADLRSQFTPAVLDLEAARNYDQSAQRASLTGALAWVGGTVRPLRQVIDSFGLVDAGGVPGVMVYVENQPVVRTDDAGIALLPHLRPYERNHVSIDPTELPLDVSVDVPSIEVVPAFRSGSYIRLPVARDHAGVFHLLQADGTPVPAGASVLLSGKSFRVGLEGLTYVTGYDHSLRAEADWNGGHCAFRLPAPNSRDPVPDAGRIRCLRSSP